MSSTSVYRCESHTVWVTFSDTRKDIKIEKWIVSLDWFRKHTSFIGKKNLQMSQNKTTQRRPSWQGPPVCLQAWSHPKQNLAGPISATVYLGAHLHPHLHRAASCQRAFPWLQALETLSKISAHSSFVVCMLHISILILYIYIWINMWNPWSTYMDFVIIIPRPSQKCCSWHLAD